MADTDIKPYFETKDTKLDGIETAATADQTGAEIKTAYQAEANAYTDAKNTKLTGIETGATKYPDTGEQAFLDGDHTKLNGIEDSATADQTGAEIKTAYQAEANAYTDTKNTKLAGIADGADVTGDNEPKVHGHSVHSNRTREIWLSDPVHYSGALSTYGVLLDPDVDEDIKYSFKIPVGFVSIANIYVYYKASYVVNANVVLDIFAKYRNIGAAVGEHTDTDNGNVIAITDSNVHRFATSGLLVSASHDDTGIIWINRDANHANDTQNGNLTIIGVSIEYIADM